jgi:glycosyltransferase involved in cell wall biosynthesis
MKVSIVIATYNKDKYLYETLKSIRKQAVSFDYEIVVVDDGSQDNTSNICSRWEVDKYIKLVNTDYRNPSVARNVGYRAARGDIIIAQSDEVIHHTPTAIEDLCNQLHEGEFIIATVYNYCMHTQKQLFQYAGRRRSKPFFFLGSLWRKDLYAIGGNDEEFVNPGFEDDWFGACLMEGLGLRCVFLADVVGYHQDHPRPRNIAERVRPSMELYKYKMAAKVFVSSGGPWEYES